MRRILFVKTSSLGDVVHHGPAVSDCARAIPGVEIDWVVEEAFAEVARLHRDVDRVVPVALRRWRQALWNPAVWREVAAFRRSLGEVPYDAVVDTQGLLKSGLLTALAPGEKHGLDRRSARESLAAAFYDARHAVPRELHAVERNRRLVAAALGYAVTGACEYGFEAHRSTFVEAPYAVMLTMTSREDKLWPEPHWIALGRALAARGLRVVLPWGSEAERARASRIALEIGGAEVPRHMALDELAGLFRHAERVAGLDTGLTHLAVALGARAAGIY